MGTLFCIKWKNFGTYKLSKLSGQLLYLNISNIGLELLKNG